MARGRFLLSVPERVVRSIAAVLGGTLYETAQIVLPRLVRRSRFYEATAKNLLRVTIELVGGVEGAASVEKEAGAGELAVRKGAAKPPVRDSGPGEGVRGNRVVVPPTEPMSVRELAVRKGAGNIVEIGSIAAFGFSPLWLLAGASDIMRGSRVYLDALVGELKRAGVLAEDADVGSVNELLGVLERGSGQTARLIDIPPVELEELRASLAELRAERETLPSPDELAAAFTGLRRTAEAENRSLLEVSSGIGLAFLISARDVSRTHLVVPYREDLQPIKSEGFAAYARRVSEPYREAVAGHFDPSRPTWTERIAGRVSKDV